jgi:hypothetical protein
VVVRSNDIDNVIHVHFADCCSVALGLGLGRLLRS